MNSRKRTDLGIMLSHLTTPKGVVRTAQHIALFAGCPVSTIQKIEWRALAKLKKKLQPYRHEPTR